jgi:hypothetical protein
MERYWVRTPWWWWWWWWCSIYASHQPSYCINTPLTLSLSLSVSFYSIHQSPLSSLSRSSPCSASSSPAPLPRLCCILTQDTPSNAICDCPYVRVKTLSLSWWVWGGYVQAWLSLFNSNYKLYATFALMRFIDGLINGWIDR